MLVQDLRARIFIAKGGEQKTAALLKQIDPVALNEWTVISAIDDLRKGVPEFNAEQGKPVAESIKL